MVDIPSQSLRSIGLFNALDESMLAAVEDACRWQEYSEGTAIVDFMDNDDSVCFLTIGRARVIIYSAGGKAVAFREIEAGEWFGEYAALDGLGRSARVEAVQDCVVGKLSAEKFKDLVETNSHINKALILHLVDQLRRLTSRVYEFSTLAVKKRVHAELLRLVRNSGVDGNVSTITNPPTHLQIANRISTHREAVTRELNYLVKIGLVSRDGHSLVVTDVKHLEQIVDAAAAE